MSMNIREEAHKMKLAAPRLAATSGEMRNTALAHIAEALRENREAIFAANKTDLDNAAKAGVSGAVVKRLKFDEGKLESVIEGIGQLISLPDPIGKVQLARKLDKGLTMYRVSCPIGVIGVIFEARPDALIQISTLCLKSGNCAILKGGKETAETNRILFRIIYKAAREAGLPEGCMLQAELHNEIDEDTCHGALGRNLPYLCRQGLRHGEGNTCHNRCQVPVYGSMQCGRDFAGAQSYR